MAIPESQGGRIVLQDEEGVSSRPIALAEVKSVNPEKPPEGWRFSGRLELGLSHETGNTNKDKVNIEGKLTAAKPPHEFTLYVETYKEESENTRTDDKSLFELKYSRFLTEKTYLFGIGRAERDYFSDLVLLTLGGAGVGYQIWKSRGKSFLVYAGPSYIREEYSEPQPSFDYSDNREYAAALWGMQFDMWFPHHWLQFFHRSTGTWSFEDSQVWRLLTRTGFRVPLSKHFFTTLQYNYDYVNSPAEGKLKWDRKASLRLGCKW